MPPSAARCDLPIALFESTNRTLVKKKVPDTFFSHLHARAALQELLKSARAPSQQRLTFDERHVHTALT